MSEVYETTTEDDPARMRPVEALYGPHTNGAANDLERTVPDLSDPEPFVTELGGETRFFESRGVARVQIGSRTVSFHIRAVPKEDWDKVQDILRPKKWPRYYDQKNEQWADDIDHPAIQAYVRTLGYARLLLGLCDITICNRAGKIVWQEPGEVRHLHEGIEALKWQGITVGHVEALTKAIDGLSRVTQEQDAGALLGN